MMFRNKLFFPRVKNLYGLKSLSYLDCKLWEELPKKSKGQNYLGACQYELRDNLLKRQSEKHQA